MTESPVGASVLPSQTRRDAGSARLVSHSPAHRAESVVEQLYLRIPRITETNHIPPQHEVVAKGPVASHTTATPHSPVSARRQVGGKLPPMWSSTSMMALAGFGLLIAVFFCYEMWGPQVRRTFMHSSTRRDSTKTKVTTRKPVLILPEEQIASQKSPPQHTNLTPQNPPTLSGPIFQVAAEDNPQPYHRRVRHSHYQQSDRSPSARAVERAGLRHSQTNSFPPQPGGDTSGMQSR